MTKKLYVVEDVWDYKNLHCAIVFNGRNCTRCGYVGISSNNYYYNYKGKFTDIDEFDVHGGITYDKIGEYPVSYGDSIRWIGFDCAHGSDAQDFDAFEHYLKNGSLVMSEQEYNIIKSFIQMSSLNEDELLDWNKGTVKLEVKKLADQVAVSFSDIFTKNLREGKTFQEAAKKYKR